MNRVNFDQDDLALTASLMQFMQNSYHMLQALSAFGGTNFILSGCIENGSSVSDGYVVINGEILPFHGGQRLTTVLVREQSETHTIQNGSHEIITRYAEFGIGSGAIAWSSLSRINNVFELLNLINNHTQDWDTITGRPSTYPPSSHTHPWDQVTNRPSTYPPSNHNQDWSTITGRPSTYPPSSHTHPWDQVTNRPSTYPPSDHNHGIDDITDLRESLLGGSSAFTSTSRTIDTIAEKNMICVNTSATVNITLSNLLPIGSVVMVKRARVGGVLIYPGSGAYLNTRGTDTTSPFSLPHAGDAVIFWKALNTFYAIGAWPYGQT